MALKKTQVDTIAQTVYRRFPELGGVAPLVRNQMVVAASANAKSTAAGQYLLTFSGKALTASGKSMPRVVRVTADANGRVLKISTSH